jgi:hypothetical protein
MIKYWLRILFMLKFIFQKNIFITIFPELEIMSNKIRFFSLFSFLLFLVINQAYSQKQNMQIFQLKVYHLQNDSQVNRVDQFLKEAFLPASHRAGVSSVGVFKPIANDTSAIKLIYVFMPFASLEQFKNFPAKLDNDKMFKKAGADYLDAAYNNIPYMRLETILLESFAPKFPMPKLSSTAAEKVYELRSYEGPTEALYSNKVDMFTKGGEVGLFKRLGFNALFYARVLAGSHMPNLMYMTSFENMASREAHWKTFGSNPEWKKLSSMPQYQHNVSHSDIILMHATDYSDL